MPNSEKIHCATCGLPLVRDKITGQWTHDAAEQPRHKPVPKEEGEKREPKVNDT